MAPILTQTFPIPPVVAHIKLDCRYTPETLAISDINTVSRAAIMRFLRTTRLDLCAQENPHSVEVHRRTREATGKWDIDDTDPKLFSTLVDASVNIATTAWGCTSLDIQVYISLFTTLLFLIDDFACSPEALGEFADRLLTDSRQLHPLLDHLAGSVRDTRNHFLPLPANDINRSIMAYVDSSALEFDKGRVSLRSNSLSYVVVKRAFDGIGRAYASLSWDKSRFPDVTKYIQAVPELTNHILYVNDIFSFYKEEIAGEQANFIHDRATVTGKSVADALNDTVDDAITATLTAREILRGTPEGEASEAVMAGYVRFHMLDGRYRLGELLGSDLDSLMSTSS